MEDQPLQLEDPYNLNYTFRLLPNLKKDGDLGIKIGIQFIDAVFRPGVNTQLRLPNLTGSTLWQVVRVDPPTNPDNQSNTIYVKKIR